VGETQRYNFRASILFPAQSRIGDELLRNWHYIYIFYSQKAAGNTKATKEKAEDVQITTIHGFR